VPALKDLATLTKKLDDRAGQLHAELTEGAIDFHKMVELADEIGSDADRLAAGFTTMAKALEESLDSGGANGGPDQEDEAD
jgi:hypothetical protein